MSGAGGQGWWRWLAAPVLALMLAGPAAAVLPDEILDDPVLEARAREMSKGLRCLVCRNENIDESNAGLARDLRLLVRERLIFQQLSQIDRLIQDDLAAAPSEANAAALRVVSGSVQATLASASNRVDLVWREEQAKLDGAGDLALEYAARANGLLTEPINNEKVVAFIVDRYGEYVLLRPTLTGANIALWISGPVMLIIALGSAALYLRSRTRRQDAPALSEIEQARLNEIMGE